jgi:hypothetical protein
LEEANGANHFCALAWVLHHLEALGHGQKPRFEQDLIPDAHFADIMNPGRHLGLEYKPIRTIQLLGDLSGEKGNFL